MESGSAYINKGMPGLQQNQDSRAQKFIDRLLTEGNKVSCDETNENLFVNDNLPLFYDEKLFRKGQDVFNKHIYAMFVGKLFGLLAILSIPSILNILIFTKMSGSDVSAYKRYMATIFHMMVWYQSDFQPGSKSWKSISEVRRMHNSASRKSCAANINRISQKDMALTQFGFIGFPLARAEKIGIYHMSEEEWEAFLHVWRVVGYLMGIENRFNICRGSVEETREICNLLIDNVFRIRIEEKNKNFLSMSRHLIRGMWAMNPVLDFKSFMTLLHDLVRNNDSSNSEFLQLNWKERCNVYIINNTVFLFKFDLYRVYQNFMMHLSLWLMKVFPFLAYYMFGRSNSHVRIKL
ncbi:hypothetical protein JTB14_034928 [Gonioctena quinquepunctata]|nr:hypothetical protein JTB14_034928 [Gonioctena quinquepunctata]